MPKNGVIIAEIMNTDERYDPAVSADIPNISPKKSLELLLKQKNAP